MPANVPTDRPTDQATADPTQQRSLGELFKSASEELSALVRNEIALAKAEVKQDVKRAITAGGAGVVALVLLMFLIMMGSFAGAYGFHNLDLPMWAAFLCVAGCYAVVILALLLLAYLNGKRIKPPQRSINSAKETVNALKAVKPRPRETGFRDTPAAGELALHDEGGKDKGGKEKKELPAGG